jgi:DNA-directed RNA polymerase subunit RPC12/RpoP
MSDTPPRRPILKLKNPPPIRAPEPPPEPAPRLGSPRFFKPARPEPPPAPPAPQHAWKCRPCGTGFTPAPDLAEEDFVRCPSCNARLGRAADFRADPPNVEKLRARYVKRSA